MKKCSVRDLLWLITLAAVLLAWWLDHSRLEERLQSLSYQTKVFAVSYVDAVSLADSVRRAHAGDRNNLLDVTSDPLTNTVIVQGNEATLSKVEASIRRLDAAASK